ncbi:MAG TPA: hypothetical protein VFZ16_11290 [Hyphomicrobiaceae bacterium]|nr:hypothetical protein [Hyphomicrobiaceae bacterium]
MKRIVMTSIGACAALVIGAGILSAQTVDEAVQIVGATGDDAAKVKLYCELNKLVQAAGDKEDEATEKQIEAAVEKLGGEFAAAWEVGEKLDDKSADAKKYYDALDALGEKCQ